MREPKSSLDFERYIFDEVHGSIGITPLENKIIDTQIYQRLRRIHHLGCASLVYPGATHNRFSHSIGSVFIIDKFARSLGLDKDTRERQLLRLVALLHDIGHLPFSHTLEGADDKEKHTMIGQNIIKMEPVSDILAKSEIKPDEVIKVLTKVSDPRYSLLIDSDLDVDKVDYLTRDAHHTGLVYGIIDVDRISRTIYFDSEKRLCVEYKSKQALENFLLARYYMYSTVYHHRTVASFELMLRLIFSGLVKDDPSLSPSQVLSKGPECFAGYTDDFLLRTMIEYKGQNEFLKELIRMYLRREPLKCVSDQIRLAKETMTSEYYTLELLRSKEIQLKELAEASKVPLEWILIDSSKPINLVSAEEAAVRIQENEESDKTIPIVEDRTSIVRTLRDVTRSCLRMYTKQEYKDQLKKSLKERYSMPATSVA